MTNSVDEAAQMKNLSTQKVWRKGDGERVLLAWKESGLSVAQFARKHGLKEYKILRAGGKNSKSG